MMDREDDQELEALFSQTRATPPKVPDALMARVLADAMAEQPAAKGTGWRQWLAGLGGLPALGGLVTATCVGFWLGVAPPEGLPDVAGVVMGADLISEDDLGSPSISGFGWDLEEG